MAPAANYLTFDLGAESGRAVLGSVQDDRISLQEVHRFANEPQYALGRYHWDTLRLFAEIKKGLAKCVREHGAQVSGIGVDTWGVDFVLLDKNDDLLTMPYHYRDSRTQGMFEKVFSLVPRDEVYQATGIQFMELNSLYQLMAMKVAGSPALDHAKRLLMTPDILNFWLTGVKANEFTNATTTQCYDPVKGDWARGMLERLGIPTGFLGDIVQPGTVLGPLHGTVQDETGAGAIQVIAPATHDTGSAVAAVPTDRKSGWAYISCGTWSLVGIETPAPIISPASLAANMTNEGGVDGTFRVLRNVMGLWLLQRCRRAWDQAGDTYSYEQLARMSADAPPFAALVEPDNSAFLNPSNMPEAISEYCRRTGQAPPATVASMVRSIVEGLAMKYRWVLEQIEMLSGDPIDTVHIIGGGSQNALLCQATADACNKRVVAGPIEATALGNIAVQAIATGRLDSIADARAIIGQSFPLIEYTPRNPGMWDDAYARFLRLLQS